MSDMSCDVLSPLLALLGLGAMSDLESVVRSKKAMHPLLSEAGALLSILLVLLGDEPRGASASESRTRSIRSPMRRWKWPWR